MKKTVLTALLLFFVGAQVMAQDTLKVVFYNLLQFPSATQTPNRQDTLAKILQYLEPDVFLVCELTNATGANQILNQSLNIGGNTHYAMAQFHTNNSTTNQLQNLVFYNSDKIRLKENVILTTDLRDIDKYVMYYNDPNLAVTGDTTWLDFYATHLKASNNATSEARRNLEITVLRDHLNTQAQERNSILGADLNVYRSSESPYQTITTTGLYPMVDPIGMPGIWNNNGSFAGIHTQSTRTVQFNGGATGGLDDRFDQILVSSSVMVGTQRVRYLPGTYRAVGQDGNHFNLSLIDPPANNSEPDSVIRALYHMSDHLPVYMELEVTPPMPLPVRFAATHAEPFGMEIAVSTQVAEWDQPGLVTLERAGQDLQFLPVADVQLSQPGDVALMDRPQVAGRYFYRFRATDANGNRMYSETVSASTALEISEVRATFAQGGLSLRNQNGQMLSGLLQVSDMQGRSQFQQWLDLSPGATRVELPPLAQGMYLVRFGTAPAQKIMVMP